MDFKNMNEVEIAAWILQENNKTPMHYKELLLKVIELKGKDVQSEAEAIAEIYTQMNMDSRFHFTGEGCWGLTEWTPQERARGSRSHSTDNLKE